MSTTTCELVQRSLDRGDSAPIDGELAEHARGCESCAEALSVATWLRRAAADESPRSLPSASHLWWRAQIIRDLVDNESRVERATRPVRWTQVIGLGVLCLPIFLTVTWLASSLFGGLQAQVTDGSVPWSLLAGLLLAGTVVPLAGFTALWVLWRET